MFTKASSSVVSFLISREIEPNMSINNKPPPRNKLPPKLISNPSTLSVWQEYTLSLVKVSLFFQNINTCLIKLYWFSFIQDKGEPLGLVVQGGLCSYENESTPVFVSSIKPKSAAEKSKHLRVIIWTFLLHSNHSVFSFTISTQRKEI